MKRLIRFLPWPLLYWIDRHFPTCWSSLVMLKVSPAFYDGWSICPTASCWDGPPGREYDYCGKYKTYEAFLTRKAGRSPGSKQAI